MAPNNWALMTIIVGLFVAWWLCLRCQLGFDLAKEECPTTARAGGSWRGREGTSSELAPCLLAEVG
jgi:hypothetical protein